MDFVLDLICWYYVWVDHSTRIFLWRVSYIGTFLRPRWHLLIMWEFTHHSCTSYWSCLWDWSWALQDIICVILKSWTRFCGLLRRKVASMVLGQSLTRVKLFKSDLVFKWSNFIIVFCCANGWCWNQASRSIRTTNIRRQLRVVRFMHICNCNSLRSLRRLTITTSWCHCGEILNILVHA